MPTVTIPLDLADRWYDWRITCDHVPCISHAAIWWFSQVNEKEFLQAVAEYRAWEQNHTKGEGEENSVTNRFREYGEVFGMPGNRQ